MSYPNEDRSSDTYTAGGTSPSTAAVQTALAADPEGARDAAGLTDLTAELEISNLSARGEAAPASPVYNSNPQAVGQFAYEAALGFAVGQVAYSLHMNADGQSGMSIDGAYTAGQGMASTCSGIGINLDGRLLDLATGGADPLWSFRSDYAMRWYGPSFFYSDISVDDPAANRVVGIGDASGKIPIVPSYVDLTAANAALAAGDYWWDTTLKKLRIATA